MSLATLCRRTLVALLGVAAFELGAREAGWLDPTLRPDPYLGLPGTPPLYRAEDDGQGGTLRRRAPNKPNYREQTFPEDKPAGELRVFVVGGSSVRSDAFMEPDGSFPALLEMLLDGAVEGRDARVVNCGGGGMGSAQNLEVVREVLGYDPDLLVVYPEGGEKNLVPPAPQGVLAMKDDAAPLRAAARRELAGLRLYAAVRDAWNALMPRPGARARELSTFSAFALALVSRPFQPAAFERLMEFKVDRAPPLMARPVPDEVLEAGHARFRRNLGDMARLCREAGVPLLFVQPVRNLRSSFYLKFHVDPRELLPGREEEWRQHYARGLQAKREGRWDEAVRELAAVRACYVADTDDILAFYLGECHEALGDMAAARAEFERPYLRHPLRTGLAEAARELGAPCLDPYPQVAAISPAGIPGFEQFTDSFHPQALTNAVLARAVLAAVEELPLGAAFRPADDPARQAGKAAVAGRVNACPPTLSSRINRAIADRRWEDAVRIGASVRPETLDIDRIHLATSLGLAYVRLGRLDEARELHAAMRKLLWRDGMWVRPLRTDEDIVTYAYARDIFAWF